MKRQLMIYKVFSDNVDTVFIHLQYVHLCIISTCFVLVRDTVDLEHIPECPGWYTSPSQGIIITHPHGLSSWLVHFHTANTSTNIFLGAQRKSENLQEPQMDMGGYEKFHTDSNLSSGLNHESLRYKVASVLHHHAVFL